MASWKELYSKEMENLEKTDKVSPLKKKAVTIYQNWHKKNWKNESNGPISIKLVGSLHKNFPPREAWLCLFQ